MNRFKDSVRAEPSQVHRLETIMLRRTARLGLRLKSFSTVTYMVPWLRSPTTDKRTSLDPGPFDEGPSRTVCTTFTVLMSPIALAISWSVLTNDTANASSSPSELPLSATDANAIAHTVANASRAARGRLIQPRIKAYPIDSCIRRVRLQASLQVNSQSA